MGHDEDVKRMLTDLGNVRRDEVAAPEEPGARLSKGAQQEREYEARLVRRKAEVRRANAGRDESNPEAAHQLRAWNTPAVFGGDDIAEQLENRYDGQGHRARLAQVVHGLDPHFGEDYRRPPRQHHPGGYGGYGGHGGHGGGQGDRGVTAQRNQPPLSDLLRNDRGLNAPQAARERASSPRGHGTVRHDPRRRQQSQRASTFIPPPANSASNIFGQGAPVAAPSTLLVPASAQAPAQPPTARAATTPTQAQAAASPASTAPSSPAPSTPAAPAPTAAPRPRALPPTSTEGQARGRRTFATTVAASMGSSNDARIPSHILEGVWNHLARTSNNPTPAQAPSHDLVTHQAAEVSAPVAPSTGTPARPPPALNSLPTVKWIQESMQEIHKQIHWALADAADPKDAGAQHYEDRPEDRHFFDIARRHIAMDAFLLMEFPDATVTEQYFRMHRDRAWIRPHALNAINGRLTNADLDPMLAELVRVVRDQLGVEPGQAPAATSGSAPAPTRHTAINSLAPVQSMGVLAGPPTPPASSDCSPAGSAHGNNMATMASPSAGGRGILSATFQDIDGNFRGVRQWPVQFPVQANVAVVARDPDYDPTEMVGMFEALALRMQARMQARSENALRPNEKGDWVKSREVKVDD